MLLCLVTFECRDVVRVKRCTQFVECEDHVSMALACTGTNDILDNMNRPVLPHAVLQGLVVDDFYIACFDTVNPTTFV